MGADIHAMIERKWVDRAGFDVWVAAGDPDIKRDYDLFSALAGVRSARHTPISQRRGLPEDTSAAFAAHAEDRKGDAYDYGWVSLTELHEYPERLADPQHWNALVNVMDWVADRYGGPENVRLVFFFA